MKITTQSGRTIDVRAAEINNNVIRCVYPKKNAGVVLGEYGSRERATEVISEIWVASNEEGLEEYKMPFV